MPHGYYVVLKRVGLSEAQHFIVMRRSKRTNSKKSSMQKNKFLVSYSLIFCPICLQENNTREGNVSVISNGAARSLLHKTARTPAPYNQSEDSGPGRSRVRGSTNQGQFGPAMSFPGCGLPVRLTPPITLSWFN